MISSFLTPMMRLIPDKRAKASELVHHAWMDGIIVQGEIELIRRAEEEELLKRENERRKTAPALAPSGSVSLGIGPEGRAKLARAEQRHHIEEQDDHDAMKPVEDDIPPQTDSSGEHHDAPPKSNHGVVTSSTGQKENQHQHPHGHRHTPSKTTAPARIDTTGTVQSPGKSSSSKKRD